ncbi:hypothetical protein M514_12651 [Trichuris suis]|uniref:Uncharacterized protein n=1 Tax=Trichuris suis TaxID=68888 RepID=A0A085LND2_9BILA|nr:hypothetical protein M513_12651 [Trichuris suis]KFD64101.1 hypothetical protein M514_12651 [Trichuris suis]
MFSHAFRYRDVVGPVRPTFPSSGIMKASWDAAVEKTFFHRVKHAVSDANFSQWQKVQRGRVTAITNTSAPKKADEKVAKESSWRKEVLG